jgi:V8-like Glu-specific endopeptidase
MTKLARRIAPIAVGGLLLAASLMTAPVADADPGNSRGPVLHRATSSKAERQRVADYWTAERMRSATVRTIAPGSDFAPQKVTKGKPAVINGKRKKQPAVEGEPYLGGPWTGGGAVVDTTGKVFFTLGGVDYVCSGSVSPASNENTVVTAGHCLNEGPGAYATNFSFVPGYHNGAAPHGEWVAETLATTEQWRTAGDFNYDVGFAVVAPVGGANLADTVGSQSVGFNQPRGEFLYAFGYPAAAPYDGQELDYCSDDATNDTLGGSDDQRLDCNLTGGSSGGPWFDDFTESVGTGVQVSLNSFGYRGEKNAMYGPYFGSVVQQLYNSVQGA